MNIDNARLERLSDFLSGSCAGGSKLAFFDFDGTIHRGHVSKKLGSYANGDLLYFLFFAALKRPGKFLRIYPWYWILSYQFLVGRLKYKYGLINRTEFEKNLIETLHYDISPHFSFEQLKKEAEKCMAYSYPSVSEFIRYLTHAGFEVVIISKAHEILLHAYRDYLKDRFNTRVTCISNPLVNGRGGGVLPVLTPEDKYRLANQVISTCSNVQKVLVVGDTEEDTGVYRAASESINGDGKLFLISVGGRSKELMDLANLRINEYGVLVDFLKKSTV
jgi:phosphoserine phosphatase